MRRRTKIVCTIGPASDDPEIMRLLLRAGMNVARLNMSHGDHDEHRRRHAALRAAAEAERANLAIMMDLQGPKIRTGPLACADEVRLVDGAMFTITTREAPGDARCVSTSYARLPEDVRRGDTMLIADGLLELRVRRVEGQDVHCRVVRGGLLGAHKGINLPGVAIAEPSLTKKDREDLAFGLDLGVDFVALSFVRSGEDIAGLRALLDETEAEVGIIAKIERPEAVARFDDVLRHTDAVMVARGDLGVEIEYEDVPGVQKRLIQRCNEAGVPAITATQMLESMVHYPRPTRAEVADVANAIHDGTDAVMLSGETAAGKHPVDACAVMAKIAFKTDEEMAAAPPAERIMRLRASDLKQDLRRVPRNVRENSFADAIGQAVCRMVNALNITRIVCFTRSGYTAAAIARFRPATRVTAITTCEATLRKCALLWGVTALLTDEIGDLDDMVGRVEAMLLDNDMVQPGDTVLIVAGTPLAVGGRTNLLKLHTVGDASA